MKWFKHDSNANMDSKLQEVLLDYGLEGYGLYFYCLELVAANVEKHNLTFELEHDARIIARNTGSTVEKVQQMMTRFIELGLFENANGVVTCFKMLSRTDEYTSKLLKETQIKLPNKNNELKELPTNSRQTPDSLGIKSELKEEKEENRKINRGFTPPTPEEVQKYLNEKGITSFTGEAFVNHYASVGWYRGKSKIKSWQHCVATWKKNNPTSSDDYEGAI